jgi:hypothetical protein
MRIPAARDDPSSLAKSRMSENRVDRQIRSDSARFVGKLFFKLLHA